MFGDCVPPPSAIAYKVHTTRLDSDSELVELWYLGYLYGAVPDRVCLDQEQSIPGCHVSDDVNNRPLTEGIRIDGPRH